MVKYAFIFGIVLMLLSCNANDNPEPDKNEGYEIDWVDAADSSSLSLADNFWNASAKYFNYGSDGKSDFHYWPQAHALDVLVDAYARTNNSSYLSYINQWYDGVQMKNGNSFLNEFYDDMEWNALAMLRAYNVTSEEKFKAATDVVWSDIKTGWNLNADGGIAWKKDQPYSKNACSNGPATILAARLFQQFGNADDKEWALKIYAWEKEHLFNPANGAVYDNINGITGETNTSWLFSYNQGTFLGSALELYKITGEKSYLNDAIKATDYTLNNLVNSNDQILKDNGTGDGGLFNGIFIRYFAQLILHPDLPEATRKRYLIFLEHNAETLWMEGTNKSIVLFGTYWGNSPAGATELTVQLSGCMLVEAVALLQNEGLLNNE
jgi:predicted alpha-1,6-mannanase (GH76 family)